MARTITYAFNRTRQSIVAHHVFVADTHWSRLRGLMGVPATRFTFGQGLWIVPCHGVHTIAMRYPIDVIYLDENHVVIHVEPNVRPWRLTTVRLDAATVLEVRSPTVWSSGTQPGDQLEIGKVNAIHRTA